MKTRALLLAFLLVAGLLPVAARPIATKDLTNLKKFVGFLPGGARRVKVEGNEAVIPFTAIAGVPRGVQPMELRVAPDAKGETIRFYRRFPENQDLSSTRLIEIANVFNYTKVGMRVFVDTKTGESTIAYLLHCPKGSDSDTLLETVRWCFRLQNEWLLAVGADGYPISIKVPEKEAAAPVDKSKLHEVLSAKYRVQRDQDGDLFFDTPVGRIHALLDEKNGSIHLIAFLPQPPNTISFNQVVEIANKAMLDPKNSQLRVSVNPKENILVCDTFFFFGKTALDADNLLAAVDAFVKQYRAFGAPFQEKKPSRRR
jgi:hypothetical protein